MLAYITLDRIHDEAISITKIVKNMTIIIAETLGYSNILKAD